jgi:cell division septation protein DedD
MCAMQVENGKGSLRFRRLRIMLDARQKRRFYIVLLMICAVSFALGYGSQVSREGPPHPETTANASGGSSQPEAAVRPTRPLSRGASLIPSGAVLLQVAASPREGDALTLAGMLRQKGFAALILEPTADKFYRVEVGPYTDRESVRLGKLALNREGFQVIVRRY